MKKTLRVLSFMLVLNMINTPGLLACTTAIVSGNGTPDGRPLLYKHRDTGFYQNKMMYFKDGKYPYIGLVNSADTEGKEIWEGANSTGFAIMNSASYNLIIEDTITFGDQEGVIMKAALQSCATLTDFERMLDEWPKPFGVEANFGVIDAQGGAAYYETDQFSYTKIDVNNPAVAPFGYVIRTNYSFTGSSDDGYGYIRYMNAERLFYQAAAEKELTYRFILQKVSRSLNHSLINVDLTDGPFLSAEKEQFVSFEDYIPRYSSVASMVVQGVRKDEDPNLTTIWTILGFPLTSVAIPTWVAGGKDLPQILLADKSGNAPLCDKALMLKKQCFPVIRGSGKKYIQLTALLNKQSKGILQKLLPLESELLDFAEQNLTSWRQSSIKANSIHEIYKKLNQKVVTNYQDFFGI